MRSLVACVAGALALLTALPAPAAPPIPPRLVVVLAVDQFSSDLYRRYSAGFTGGLKRLGSGIAYPVGYQSHAATETCPGHSTILTGDHPSRTGIVANSWFERSTGSTIYCVSVPGTGDPDARGPQRLRVTTLGDWMKAAYPNSRVISVSGKDRAAVMLGGHYADVVTWWRDGVGFTTSAFAAPAAQAASPQLNSWNLALKGRWRASRPDPWPRQASARCSQMRRSFRSGQVDLSGDLPPAQARGVTDAPNFFDRTEFQAQLKSSPLLDALTLELAADLAHTYRLGSRSSPDLLAVSLSATDYVGHRFGPGGPEMCEQLHDLDRGLARFLETIDELGVPYVVVLTADHGSADAAERARAQGTDAERLDPVAFIGALNRSLRGTLGLDYDPIAGDDPQQLYVNVAADSALRRKVRDAALEWLRVQPQVVRAFTSSDIASSAPDPRGSPADLTTAERFHESFDSDRSGDILVELRKNESVGIPRAVGDYVAGHGSPWDYDRQVPILFWWRNAPSRISNDPVETTDIAPTLAAIVGLVPPDVDGRCLNAVADCPGGPFAF